METLKDKLLDGKVIGETFMISNPHLMPHLMGTLPSNYSYKVRDLESGAQRTLDYINLVVEGQDSEEHHFPLAFRLKDVHIPTTSSQMEQIVQSPQQER